MKNLMFTLLFATLGLLAFLPTSKKLSSPIDGAWEFFSTESGGKTTFHKKPRQIKVYCDGYYCMMGYDSTGTFRYAGAGTYELEGNKYKETYLYYSAPVYLGTSIWFDWAMSGDTLLFYGYKKVTKADGTDVTKDWGGDSKIEKKVRVKK